MAVDMFIKLSDIKGESKDHKHKDEIDILAWSWGMSNSGGSMGGGMGAGKVSMQDISFTKYVDASSNALMLRCCAGKHVPEAVLVVRKAGDKPLEYIKITLNEVLVSGVSTGGSGGEDRLTENVTLRFAKVKFEYQKQAKDGGADGGPLPAGWDVKANQKW